MKPAMTGDRGAAGGVSAGGRTARCPRCGYDQRGVIAQWIDACELHTTCAECGLDIFWPEILSEKLSWPGWCIEHAKSRGDFLKRVFLTFGMMFRPRGFWRSLKMVHEVRLRRVAAFLLALVVGLYLLFVVGHTVHVGIVWMRAADQVLVRGYSINQSRITSQQWANYQTDANPAWTLVHALILPVSDESPGVLMRGGPASTTAWMQTSDVMHVDVSATGAMPATLPHPSPGAIAGSYPAVLGEASIAGVVAFNAAFLLLCVGFFALLPASRRKAKVRWAHLMRIGAYSLASLFVPAAVVLVMIIVFAIQQRYSLDVGFTAAPIATLFILIAALIWWWQATKHYLKMPHALGVALAAVVFAAAAELCAMAWYAVLTFGP